MPTTNSSSEVVRSFFAAFGSGDLDGIVAVFHPDAHITAVRPGARGEGQLYGSYSGAAGVREFVGTLGRLFETQAFSVDHVVGLGEVAFASGRFTHRVRATDRVFRSDWALKCVIRDGAIFEYHFYEDSAAYVEASAEAR